MLESSAPMNRLAMLLAATALILAMACGGGSSDDQPEAGTSTRSPTVSGSRAATPSGRTATVMATASSTATEAVISTTTAPPETLQPIDAPPPTVAPTAQPLANGNPSFPQQFLTAQETTYDYDDNGVLTGAVTTMTVPSASDPDGDPLVYTWAASSGSISGSGTSGTWYRIIEGGQEAPGTVTVTASDGRGGSAAFVVDFQ